MASSHADHSKPTAAIMPIPVAAVEASELPRSTFYFPNGRLWANFLTATLAPQVEALGAVPIGEFVNSLNKTLCKDAMDVYLVVGATRMEQVKGELIYDIEMGAWSLVMTFPPGIHEHVRYPGDAHFGQNVRPEGELLPLFCVGHPGSMI